MEFRNRVWVIAETRNLSAERTGLRPQSTRNGRRVGRTVGEGE